MRLGRTLGELGATMSSAEFSLWLALYRREPWDDTRMDVGFGIVASTLANYAGKTRKEGEPASPLDFMPFVKKHAPAAEEEPDPVEYFRRL